MTTRRDTPVWLVPLAAAVVGAALAWAQVSAALGLGVLAFGRRFDAGTDNDWLSNYRNALWLCATAVVVAVLVTRAVFPHLDARSRWAAVPTAALGVGTVLPHLMDQASRAQHVNLVDQQTSASAAQAALVGIALGAATSLILGTRAASARVSARGAVTGAAVLWILLAVSAAVTGPPVLGALELAALGYDARVAALWVSALIVSPVIAALVSLVARRETTAALTVAGLLTASGVLATILLTMLVGPAPSGDHTDLGREVALPLLLGGVLAFGLLTTVARLRRQGPRSGTVTSSAGQAR